MKLNGFDHVTVVVTDPERAAAFYRDVLGLQEVAIPSTFPSAGLRVRWLRTGNQYVHLYISPEADSKSPRHMALHVDDAQAARAYFSSKGIAVRETVAIPGADRFFIADPDGNRIELIQWRDASAIAPVA